MHAGLKLLDALSVTEYADSDNSDSELVTTLVLYLYLF